MTPPRILLVDDHRETLRLLRSALDTLGHKFEVYEAPSGEEALLEANRHRFDLLVADYRLPGINGVELLTKVRARNPEVKVVLISGVQDRKAREEMRNAGAFAVFEKPISLSDFLDVVERALGLERTILPPEDEVEVVDRQTIADALTNLRQQVNAQAVYLLSDRGRVLERAGDLPDSSMEVSLLAAIMAIFAAGQKVSRFVHQPKPEHYHVFHGGDYDLILMPLNALYGLLVAGEGLGSFDRLMGVLETMLTCRQAVEHSLRSLGVSSPAVELSDAEAGPTETGEEPSPSSDLAVPDLDRLLEARQSINVNVDSFWEEAAEKHATPPLPPDVLSYEQAKRLGLAPRGHTRPLAQK